METLSLDYIQNPENKNEIISLLDNRKNIFIGTVILNNTTNFVFRLSELSNDEHEIVYAWTDLLNGDNILIEGIFENKYDPLLKAVNESYKSRRKIEFQILFFKSLSEFILWLTRYALWN